MFRFGQVSKSEQAPTPTHARRHPAFAEFCKACTRPLLRENGRKDPHSSPQPADLLPPHVSAPPRHQLCGFWTVVQITHTRTREEALLENSPKVHFGTPHLHARGGDVVRILTTFYTPTPTRARRHLFVCQKSDKHDGCPHPHARGGTDRVDFVRILTKPTPTRARRRLTRPGT